MDKTTIQIDITGGTLSTQEAIRLFADGLGFSDPIMKTMGTFIKDETKRQYTKRKLSEYFREVVRRQQLKEKTELINIDDITVE